jgi:hypothetical protein
VALVDEWKKADAATATREKRSISDREALAHLLCEGAPAAVRMGKLDRRVLVRLL